MEPYGHVLLGQSVNIKDFLTKSAAKYKFSPQKQMSSVPSKMLESDSENGTIYSLNPKLESQNTLVERQSAKTGRCYFKTIES
jgi:hypothetical protein